VGWQLSADEIASLDTGPVHLVIDHPAFAASTELGPDTLAELRRDLREGG
jgi:hypothetical protein